MNAYTGRREDPRFLTGTGRYTADFSLPGQAHAAFLRSDVAHATISGIDVTEAAAAPGVLAVLTGKDMEAAGFWRVVPHMPFPGKDGMHLMAVKKPALPVDRVRYVGEPVAIVVAETLAQARDALELIALDLDPLDVASTRAGALEPGAPQLHDEVPGNLAFVAEYGDEARTEAAFAAAEHVVTLELESHRVVAAPMEPKACLAHWTAADSLDLWCPSQGMTAITAGMAAATGLPPKTFRVLTEDVGGAFGVRGEAYPEYIAIALAARVTGRPVKWVASRSETFVSDSQGRAITMKAELALDVQGRFLAIRHDWICDLGALPAGAGPITGVMNAGTMAFGAYRIPAVYGQVRQALTNHVPITAYRGAARPEMAYAVERVVDAAARKLGLDRIDIRRRNAIPRDAFPYQVPTAPMPSTYDSGDFSRLIDSGLAAADWAGFEARRSEASGRGRLRGIGCALFIEPAGGVAPVDEVSLTFMSDGTIRLHQVAHASGQGYETVYPEIVGKVLEIDPERISMGMAGPDTPAQKGGGAFGSRSLMTQGSVFDEGARQALAKARVLAAEMLEVAPDALDYEGGAFQARGTNRHIGLAEIAAARPGELDTIAELPSPRAFPSGMHVAEVEIDPETGVTDLVSYVSIDDCGTVLNETLVHGQIWGGLAQGLGQVFGEECRFDEDGQLLSGSFMDYTMPRADLMGRVKIIFEGVPSPGNRLGAKGVGESGTVGALPAAMNAILDALAPAGVTRLDMPATPLAVWQALQDA